MKIKLLGTGAADGIPSPFGTDRISAHARAVKGKEIRTRSGAIVDGTIKIDLSPDTYMQLLRENLSATDWTALFFTHSDDDHLAVSEIQYALEPFIDNPYLPYTIFANRDVADLIRARYPGWPIEIRETRSYECYQHLDYRVTTIQATHLSDEDCHNFIFQRDSKTLLYATDTGLWSEKTWQFLERFRLDALVIECTDGFNPSPYIGHLSLEECLDVVTRLRKSGILHSEAQVVTTHHGVRGNATHEELIVALAPHGIQAGFDGMTIDV